MTKEKLDRQLTRQPSSTPFMSIRDGHNRRVSFDTKNELGDKIDKLAVMIGKLAGRDNGTGRQFKPQSIKVEVEVRIEITIWETIRTVTDQITGQIVVTEDNTNKKEVDLEINKIIREVTLEEMWGTMVDKTVEESTETALGMTVMREAEQV